MFQAELVLDDKLDRAISIRDFRACGRGSADTTRRKVCELLSQELSVLVENHRPRVALIALPLEILERVEPAAPGEVSSTEPRRRKRTPLPVDFHDLLKAQAMRFRTPIQIINPDTYDPTVKRRQKGRNDRLRQLQDETTRAWNLHAALYYKGGGYPWRLPREDGDLATCFLGFSFFRTLDDESV
jgi:hypothetical protein